MLGRHGLTSAMYRAVVAVVDERTEMIRTLRTDFDRLTHAVGELAQAQARTDASLQTLAQAQARTEARMDRVEAALDQLAQAQARTEARMEELAQAQRELAQAQARTEVAVGRLGEDIGFGLEDVARLLLPPYLHKHYGIQLAGPAGEELQPRFFPLPGQPPAEINLYGEGQRDGQKVVVLGESKARIGGSVVKDFVDVLAQVEPLVQGEVWRVMFGYYIHPSAQPVAQEHRIVLVASYQR